jgi:carbon-monoxide dehydrogenase large subunit
MEPLEVKAGIHTIGQGLKPLAQIAHEQTGRPSGHSRTLGDTASTPFSTGAYASRGIVMSAAPCRAAENRCKADQAIAAHLLQVDTEVLASRMSNLFGNASVAYADVGCAWYRARPMPDSVNTGGLETTEGYKPLVDSGVFFVWTHATRVAVDPETGPLRYHDYVVVEDAEKW